MDLICAIAVVKDIEDIKRYNGLELIFKDNEAVKVPAWRPAVNESDEALIRNVFSNLLRIVAKGKSNIYHSSFEEELKKLEEKFELKLNQPKSSEKRFQKTYNP